MTDRRIVDYVLLCASHTHAPGITDLLEQGYQPYGSPYWSRDIGECQAMVKYEEKFIGDWPD